MKLMELGKKCTMQPKRRKHKKAHYNDNDYSYI
ncbi:hypothetical protein CAEBREN_13364 [Caenorhabditis brenneri]|uniref:Uncharacterized protein n=1 Tax=Caenorhabditis brenneri TaxID=135651 RepID=G0NKC0_CAEBE|nr:hypothetical protein CAEBREN_13364 [Caenorhabditis brenneri]